MGNNKHCFETRNKATMRPTAVHLINNIGARDSFAVLGACHTAPIQSQSRNFCRPRDLLLPRLRSGQVELKTN